MMAQPYQLLSPALWSLAQPHQLQPPALWSLALLVVLLVLALA